MHPFGFAESFLRCAIHGVVVGFHRKSLPNKTSGDSSKTIVGW
jgi:hypothetical protein